MTKPTCKSSTVMPSKLLVDFEMHEWVSDKHKHGGTIVHVCSLPEGHTELCLCGCGRQWRKFGDVK